MIADALTSSRLEFLDRNSGALGHVEHIDDECAAGRCATLLADDDVLALRNCQVASRRYHVSSSEKHAFRRRPDVRQIQRDGAHSGARHRKISHASAKKLVTIGTLARKQAEMLGTFRQHRSSSTSSNVRGGECIGDFP